MDLSVCRGYGCDISLRYLYGVKMIISVQLIVNKQVEDYLDSLLKNILDMNIAGVLSFTGSVHIYENDGLKPESIVMLYMYSPIDFLFPKFLKRWAFKKGLKKLGYAHDIKFIKDQDMLVNLVHFSNKVIGYKNGTNRDIGISKNEEE